MDVSNLFEICNIVQSNHFSNNEKINKLEEFIDLNFECKKSTKKIYKHSGTGQYLGCFVIAIANSLEEASVMIKEKLTDNGLENEKLNIFEQPLKNGVIYIDDGDY